MNQPIKWLLLALTAFLAACTTAEPSPIPPSSTSPQAEETAEQLLLPQLQALPLDGRPLRVVATTSIIGDVVAQVGGEVIELTVLMSAGQDPHSYEPSARDFAAVANADVLFVNGWGLEEGLLRSLANTAPDTPLIPISAGIVPLAGGHEDDEHGHEDEEHADDDHADDGEEHDEHEGADPHVWFRVANVRQWVANVQTVLGQLDPAHAADYGARAEAYTAELTQLEQELATQLAVIPADKRKIVTNHDVFTYFAAEYGFEVVGTVIPGLSTMSEPSASSVAGLVDVMQAEGVCTIFTENTTSGQLSQTIGQELVSCAAVQILPLFTDALGPQGSGAESYLQLMRTNTATIVAGLQE